VDPMTRRAIEADCAKVATSYSVFLDFRRCAELVDLFTETATLNLDGWLLDGQAAIREYMFSRPNSRTNRHVCSCRCALNFDHPCALNFDQGVDSNFS